jgi:hypothetical protein
MTVPECDDARDGRPVTRLDSIYRLSLHGVYAHIRSVDVSWMKTKIELDVMSYSVWSNQRIRRDAPLPPEIIEVSTIYRKRAMNRIFIYRRTPMLISHG